MTVLANGSSNGALYEHPEWSDDSTTVYYDELPPGLGPSIFSIKPGTPSPPGPNGTDEQQVTGGSGSEAPCASEFPNLG